MNLQDKRIQKRLLKIEQELRHLFYDDSSKEIHHQKLIKIFGQGQNELTSLLRTNILIKIDKQYIIGEKCIGYNVNWNNLAYFFQESGLIKDTFILRELISFQDHTENNRAKDAIDVYYLTKENLLKKNAEYRECETTTRLLSSFQNIPKRIREEHFKGWFDYDIEAAGYSLVTQHYLNNVLPWWGSADVIELKILPLMYANKDFMRAELSRDLNISIECVKQVLAFILFSPNLYYNPYSHILKVLSSEGIDVIDFFHRVKHNDILKELMFELQNIWPKLELYWNNQNTRVGKRIYKGKSGLKYKPSSFHARIYFELERSITNIVLEFIKQKSPLHIIHDGFFLNNEINQANLEKLIKERTSFEIKYSMKQF
jgi:hypothetical protein